jgi:8-oxo-dGTP pyrophosphatase MutT (NUDIX family)
MDESFPVYKTASGAVEGWFEPDTSLPPRQQIVGVVVLPFLEADRIVAVKVRKRRAWEFPGGHVEEGEGLSAAARREAREEAGVELGRLHLIGRKWLRVLDPQQVQLRRYDGRCLLVYWADVTGLHDLVPNSEISERCAVRAQEAGEILGGYWPTRHLMEILEHALSERGKRGRHGHVIAGAPAVCAGNGTA